MASQSSRLSFRRIENGNGRQPGIGRESLNDAIHRPRIGQQGHRSRFRYRRRMAQANLARRGTAGFLGAPSIERAMRKPKNKRRQQNEGGKLDSG